MNLTKRETATILAALGADAKNLGKAHTKQTIHYAP